MILSDIRQIQPKAWELLSRSVASGRVASTYLFSGKEGLGHWPLALSFAALLNCPNRKELDGVLVPCGECPSCHQIATLNSPFMHFLMPIPSLARAKRELYNSDDEPVDVRSSKKELSNESLTVLEIEKKREEPFRIPTAPDSLSMPIDLARDIRRKMSLMVENDVTRVVVFYQMERMLQASADVLLKFIEEPPRNSLIILTADNPDILLPTIRSRAQLIRLERVNAEICAKYLATKYSIAQEKALLFAKVTDGNVGRAVELASDEENEELSQRATGFLLFKTLILEPGPEAVSRALEFIQKKGEAEAILLLWGSLIRDCANYAVTGDETQIINLDYAADIKRLSQPFVDPEVAPAMTTAIKNTLADLQRNVHIQPSVAALSLRLGAALRTAR